MSALRTRVAPSPTGAPHLGTAYVALFNYAYARSMGGSFLLRIEDTDRQRSSAEAEREIIAALRWLGLDWDEGPDVGGDAGPYRQSERGGRYRRYAEQLVASGQAFYCFATPGELVAMRAEQRARGETPRYDGRALMLSASEVARRRAAGEPHVIRLKVPDDGACGVDDLLRGAVSIDWREVDMQVLLKADGQPTYHLANVVDDHEMRISHVVRGEEWLSSTPKHLLLCRALGWEPPQYCHLPLLRNPDHSKLSKRRNPTSIFHYRDSGYLPEALLNYLARMGWSMPDEREHFSLAELIEHFDLARVSLGGPVFDPDKLDWLNGQWLRSLAPEELQRRLVAWRLNPELLAAAMEHLQPRMERLSDLVPLGGFLLGAAPVVGESDYLALKPPLERQREVLQWALWEVEARRFDFGRDALFGAMAAAAEALALPLRDCCAPLFVAITGRAVSISVVDAMALLGPDLCAARLRQALGVLGAPPKKRRRQLEALRERFGSASAVADSAH